MAGAIAHHFNNKLQAVMMSLELAIGDLVGNEDLGEDMTAAMLAAREAAEVSSLMLTYLGQSVARREPLDLCIVCHNCLGLLRAVMPEGFTLQTDLPAPGPTICADANQIQHVLANLVTNAWEASGDARGAIHLTVRTVGAADIPVKHRFPIDYHPQDDAYACLEVSDSSCGIEDHEIEKIFDPFFSSKFPGRGLGLAEAIGIARTHNGAIAVQSDLGRGSIFRVYLPIQLFADC